MSLTIAGVGVVIDGTEILRDVDLRLEATDTVVLLGPSGSGKTTLLRAVAGLVPLATGAISWDGEDLVAVPTHERRLGMVFQDYALFPHLTVGRNVAFGLEIRRQDSAGPVEAALRMVGLDGFAHRSVEGLSGGEQQRVALARALVTSPRLMLLDEPLGALDASLGEHLLSELRRLLAPLPAIYVTHDRSEAMAIADRIALMRGGTIVRVDTPVGIWTNPMDTWTARFIGHENVFEDSYVPASSIRESPDGTHGATVLDRRFAGGLWHSSYRLDDGRIVTALVGDPSPGTDVRLDFTQHGLSKT